MSDNIQVKRNFKDADGQVMIAPKNITNKPPKKGRVGEGCTFGGVAEHMPCDYNNARKVALAEYKIHKHKCLDGGDRRPFSSRARSYAHFNTVKEVIGEDIPIPQRPPVPERKYGLQQEAPFKPNVQPPRSGYNCSLATFPEYKPNPPAEKVRKHKVEGEADVPPAFRSTYKYKSRPQSSVATNLRNLKASYSSIFRR